MEDIILIGYGGHAKSVADCIIRQGKYRIVGYTDIDKSTSAYTYLGNDECLDSIYKNGIKNAVIAIGYMGKGTLRRRLIEKAKEIGFTFPTIIDPSAIVSESADIGEGVFIGKLAVINAEAKIGSFSIINTMALVEHECIVEEYSHVAVAAVLCGNVKVGKDAFIGANATVIQGRQIEAGAIVPAGVTIR